MKGGVESGECKVRSVELKEESGKCKLWGAQCDVESVECKV